MDIWWKEASVYQIWPASFKDSNGDGIGDIPGIISKLNYVKDLGVDVIWLSPMYDSPQDDMGYDISDYEKIYPKYGTMEDMDNLIKGCRARGLKLILDLVINHTSIEHEWFKESKSSKTNPKRDWYIWKKPKYDKEGNRHPPNNWGSKFSGSAWEYDETTEEYYLHLFAASQPDLNWENEECRKAIYQTSMVFWFEKGIDGFRIDTAGLYSKEQQFLDAPIVFPEEEFQPSNIYTSNGPRIHEFHKEMFKNVTSNYDAMTVGEVGYCAREDALKYVSAKEKEMNTLFLFDLVNLDCPPGDRFNIHPFTLIDIKKAVKIQCDFTLGTDAWTTVFIENHDQPRSVSRFGTTKDVPSLFKSAKLIALMQATLSGTLFIYQGQEIGMINAPRDWDIKEFLDVKTITCYNNLKAKHGITDPEDPILVKYMDMIHEVARDHGRLPVQWDDSAHGGFSTVKPWMRIHDNYPDVNVASQKDDPKSVLSFYKSLLELRKKHKDVLIYGDFEILDFDNEKLFTYTKTFGDSKAYVVLNFSEDTIKFEPLVKNLKFLVSNVDNITDSLSPWEGRVYLVQ